MRAVLVAVMIAFAAVGLVAVAAAPAAAQPPCDLQVLGPPNCCIYEKEGMIYWERCR